MFSSAFRPYGNGGPYFKAIIFAAVDGPGSSRGAAAAASKTGTSALLIVPKGARRRVGPATGPLSTFKDLAATRGDRLP